MQKINMYKCDLCSEKYEDMNQAKDCENSHYHNPTIESMDYRPFEEYPDSVTLRFGNYCITYRLDISSLPTIL